MITLKLELYSKNMAVYQGSPFEIQALHVPRVGEILNLEELSASRGESVTTFIVIDVTHVLENGSLVPYIDCRQWYKGDRHIELSMRGWLPPLSGV